jgi:hypothetical protein
MPVGPGKYDDLTTLVREATSARAVILIVTEGNKGSGFSVQTTDMAIVRRLPQVLREMADEIERELP